MAQDIREKRDLVLPPSTYAFMQDVTKGVLKCYTGPTVINPTAQEVPVVYDPKSATFLRCDVLEQALRKSPVVVEGFYCVLLNPSKLGNQPGEGMAQAAPDLDIGRKVIIPGPAAFALWPGQVAEVIRGHHLRSNQYLLCRVYNEEQAKKNWAKAVVKLAEPQKPVDPNAETKPEEQKPVTLDPPPDLTVGKMLIIKGTEVSFYIPPTGIVVVPDGECVPSGKPNYVREALTLERLEYAILRDESGEKRYENGPMVVFPKPTERFLEAEGSKKFRAIELNELQGIHIKVIADYTEGTKKYKAGQELFITGKDTAIYYPREEHSAIKYDGKTKHFATAVPVGEARYVLNRMTGEIRTVRGPDMLLPDPRTEVIVRRVLSDKQCALWYPANTEALLYNQGLRAIMASVPTTRGAISDGDYERGTRGAKAKNEAVLRGQFGDRLGGSTVASASVMNASNTSRDQNLVGEEFSRASTYSQPRTIELNTKYQGAPSVDVWTGYAVLVVDKRGNRRVEIGPKTIVLDYDESLEVLELSTGKPKTTDDLLRTVYLRVENNQVTDLVRVETSDHVQIDLRLSYRVNFEGDNSKWFSVENYIKLMCDHVRSVLKGTVKKIKVEDFYANSTDMLRETILGSATDSKRPGMKFDENGMRIIDVEVLGVAIADANIRVMLDSAQLDVVKTNIDLSNIHRNFEALKEKESISRQQHQLTVDTQKLKHQLDIDLAAAGLAVSLTRIGNKLKEIEQNKDLVAKEQDQADFIQSKQLCRNKQAQEQQLAINKAEQELELEKLKAETLEITEKFKAAQGGFSQALLALSNNETMVKVAEAWNIQRALGGENISDAIRRIFAGTALEGVLEKVVTK